MVLGLQQNKLQNDLFCMTEERNYFQGKYLEQVSEIAAMKEELIKARREISKLRAEILNNGVDGPKEQCEDDEEQDFNADDTASLTEDEEEEDSEAEDEDEEDKEAANIRQSAEKLLQWASYREYAPRSSSSRSLASSVASPNESLLGPMIPRTIESSSLLIGTDDNDDRLLSSSLSHDSGATQPTSHTGSFYCD